MKSHFLLPCLTVSGLLALSMQAHAQFEVVRSVEIMVTTEVTSISDSLYMDLISSFESGIKSDNPETRLSAVSGLLTIAQQTSSESVQRRLLASRLVNWNFNNSYQSNGGRDYLFEAIRMLSSIRPASQDIERLLADRMNEALRSESEKIRTAAGDMVCGAVSCQVRSESGQMRLLEHLGTINWSFRNSYQDGNGYDHLRKAIRALSLLRPESNEVQDLRVQALVKALHSDNVPIRDAAANALLTIATEERDTATQKSLLKNITVNWNYSNSYEENNGRTYLEKTIKLLTAMRPMNEKINSDRIQMLGNVATSKTQTESIRTQAAQSLCEIGRCAIRSSQSQLELVRQFLDLNWDFSNSYQDNGGRSFLELAIRTLRHMDAMTPEIQSERIRILARALRSNTDRIRSAAGDALIAIATTDQDAHTQKELLRTISVNWNYSNGYEANSGRDYLFKILTVIEVMESASLEIHRDRIAVLSQASRSQAKVLSQRAMAMAQTLAAQTVRLDVVEIKSIETVVVTKTVVVETPGQDSEVDRVLRALNEAKASGRKVDVMEVIKRAVAR